MAEKNVKLVNFRATPEEIGWWDDAAHAARMSRQKWMCHVLNQAVNQASVLPRDIPPAKVSPTTAHQNAEALLERAVQAKNLVNPAECLNRLPKGAFCKRCGRVHA